MAKTMTTQQQADLANNLVPKAVIWFASLYLDTGTLRFSDQAEGLTYDSEVFEPAHKKWKIPTEISTGSALVPERIDFQFDGADRYVGGSLFARILAGGYHLRKFDLACAVYNASTGAFIVEAHKIYGFIDQIKEAEGEDHEPWAIMSCETGTYRMLGNRQTQCSDEDQRLRNATDGFFKNTGVKGSENIPFGIKSSNIPGINGASGSSGSASTVKNLFG